MRVLPNPRKKFRLFNIYCINIEKHFALLLKPFKKLIWESIREVVYVCGTSKLDKIFAFWVSTNFRRVAWIFCLFFQVKILSALRIKIFPKISFSKIRYRLRFII